ncbi:MAG: succinate dehydrogenase assembly factor 2 [Proteobacteria bacterium]|nr:succinate dehydrogenase assembly factor 2 [Pseudomonadota bacterium]
MNADAARLRWRCRRGMRELDQLLGWWLDARFAQAGNAEKSAFSTLLDAQDPQLWDWFCGRGAPHDPGQRRIVDEIRNRDCV